MLLLGYSRSQFRDFENYLKNVFGLVDIQLISKPYNSNFVPYEIPAGIYSIKDFSEVVCTMGDHERILQIKYDNIFMKTKLICARSKGNFGTLRCSENSSFKTSVGFTSFWGYKPTSSIHANSAGVYTSEKILNLVLIDKIHLKCDCIDGSVVN